MDAEAAVPVLLRRLYTGEGIFGHTPALLAGLDGERAVLVPPGLPHSVAGLVAHCAYWLELYLRLIRTGDATALDQAHEEWTAVDAADWPALRERFEALCAEAIAMAATPDIVGSTRAIHGRDIPVATLLGDLAGHNAYHLGQVVLIRRLLGAWPADAATP